MSAYKELLQQREALEIQIKEARARELSDAIALVRKTVDEFGLTVSDVFRPSDRRSASKGSKVEPKYRNPAQEKPGLAEANPRYGFATKTENNSESSNKKGSACFLFYLALHAGFTAFHICSANTAPASESLV